MLFDPVEGPLTTAFSEEHQCDNYAT